MPLKGFEVDGETVIGSKEALSTSQSVPERLVDDRRGLHRPRAGQRIRQARQSKVSVVEFLPELAAFDLDPEVGEALVKTAQKGQIGAELYLGHKRRVLRAPAITGDGSPSPTQDGETMRSCETGGQRSSMMSIGRVPNSRRSLGFEDIGLATWTSKRLSSRSTTECRPMSAPGIYAIGDVVGGALLAHKAYQEAKVAAEVICRPASILRQLWRYRP